MIGFDEYIAHGERGQNAKVFAWQTTFGLQDMNWLKVLAYMFDTARQPIKGKIFINKTQ